MVRITLSKGADKAHLLRWVANNAVALPTPRLSICKQAAVDAIEGILENGASLAKPSRPGLQQKDKGLPPGEDIETLQNFLPSVILLLFVDILANLLGQHAAGSFNPTETSSQSLGCHWTSFQPRNVAKVFPGEWIGDS